MKKMILGESGFERKTKCSHTREFLDEINLVMTRAELIWLIDSHVLQSGEKGGLPPFAVSIGVDADSGLGDTVTTTLAKTHDFTQTHTLLHRPKTEVFADLRYRVQAKKKAKLMTLFAMSNLGLVSKRMFSMGAPG